MTLSLPELKMRPGGRLRNQTGRDDRRGQQTSGKVRGGSGGGDRVHIVLVDGQRRAVGELGGRRAAPGAQRGVARSRDDQVAARRGDGADLRDASVSRIDRPKVERTSPSWPRSEQERRYIRTADEFAERRSGPEQLGTSFGRSPPESPTMDSMDILVAGAGEIRDSKKKKLKQTVTQTNLDLESYSANYKGGQNHARRRV